jgi:hypothetical protein
MGINEILVMSGVRTCSSRTRKSVTRMAKPGASVGNTWSSRGAMREAYRTWVGNLYSEGAFGWTGR